MTQLVSHVDTAFLGHLRDIGTRSGTWSSLYLRLVAGGDDDEQVNAIEWKNAVAELEQRGAGNDAIAAMAVAFDQRDRTGGMLCLLVRDATVELAIQSTRVLDRSAVDVGVTPRLVPLVALAQSFVPHVVVVIDRVGADITAVRFDRLADAETVAGDSDLVHRGHPGGWSQRRFQQRSENQWESNAREVAEEVARLADEISAELVIVAGDVRACQFLTEHLPAHITAVSHEIDGARDGVSDEAIAEQSVRLEASAVAEQTVSLLQEFRNGGSAGLSTSNVDDTLAALSERRVATLIVGDDSASLGDEDVVSGWCSSQDPTLVAATNDSALLGADAVEAPLGDVAIRSALLGGSEIRVVPIHALDAPIAAVLRFAT